MDMQRRARKTTRTLCTIWGARTRAELVDTPRLPLPVVVTIREGICMRTINPDDKESPFAGVLAELGATFASFAGGVLWADHFGDLHSEYAAQREGVGVFDASAIHKWEFKGPGATAAVQHVHTNNIEGLAVGQVRYGAMCDSDGHMFEDAMVFKLSNDHLWLMTNGGEHGPYLHEVTAGFDATITRITDELPHLFVQGPKSRELISAITEADVESLRYFRFYPEMVEVGGVLVWLSRTGVSGEIGYELFVRPENAPALLRALVEAGATPYGLAAIRSVRIESGMIVQHMEYIPHQTSPLELSFDAMIDLSRDFIGRDSLSQQSLSGPNRRITTVALANADLPRPGAELRRDGVVVGTLTSAVVSPLFGPISLALIDVDLMVPGYEFSYSVDAGEQTARIADTHSIYDPEKKRPRG